MTGELKPCPFCGGKASVKMLEYDDDCKVWGVFCESDLECEYSHGHFVDNYPTEAEAIDAWNTRAQTVFGMTLDEVRQMMKRDAERERTCSGALDFDGWFICESCGCQTKGNQYGELPRYCSNCDTKVVE